MLSTVTEQMQGRKSHGLCVGRGGGGWRYSNLLLSRLTSYHLATEARGRGGVGESRGERQRQTDKLPERERERERGGGGGCGGVVVEGEAEKRKQTDKRVHLHYT